MLFKLHIPGFPLNQFIESFVYYRDYNPVHSVDRFLPDGNVNIVFDLTDYPKFIYDNETLKEIQTCRNVWFSGIRNRFITIPSGKDSEMFVINFHKGMSYPFVKVPLYELTDSVVDGDLVLSTEIMDMRSMLLEAPTPAGKFTVAEKYLLRRFSHSLIVNPFIKFAVNAIIALPEQHSIRQISSKVGYSQKDFLKSSVFKRPSRKLKRLRIFIGPGLHWKVVTTTRPILFTTSKNSPDSHHRNIHKSNTIT